MANNKLASTVIAPEFSEVVVNVTDNVPMGSATLGTSGKQLSLDNPLVQNQADANALAEWVKSVVENRVLLSGEYRADPRADAVDKITVQNKYASSLMIITDMKYSFSGSFHGQYSGRVIGSEP